jgi:hypothetical protein
LPHFGGLRRAHRFAEGGDGGAVGIGGEYLQGSVLENPFKYFQMCFSILIFSTSSLSQGIGKYEA